MTKLYTIEITTFESGTQSALKIDTCDEATIAGFKKNLKNSYTHKQGLIVEFGDGEFVAYSYEILGKSTFKVLETGETKAASSAPQDEFYGDGMNIIQDHSNVLPLLPPKKD